MPSARYGIICSGRVPKTEARHGASGEARDRSRRSRRPPPLILRERSSSPCERAHPRSRRARRARCCRRSPCRSCAAGSRRRCADKAARSGRPTCWPESRRAAPLRVVEAERLDDRAVQDDERLAARRVAAVLDAVARIGHGFDERDQERHVFRPAARHDAVHRDAPHGRAAPVGQQDAELLVRVAIGVTQESLDLRRASAARSAGRRSSSCS